MQKKAFVVFLYSTLLAFFALAQNLDKALPREKGENFIYTITIDGSITPFIADYVSFALDKAALDKAQALLIYLDTPGGVLEATRTIVQAMLQSAVPIIVYISPPGARAGSAGVFISLAAHVVAMAPSSNIGAAHPVTFGGGDVPKDMKDKVTNDAAAWARSIAETRGKNSAWAEKAVLESKSLSAHEALKLGVIDIIASNTDELMKALHNKKIHSNNKSYELVLENVELVPLPMTARQKLMNFLANPNLIYILLLLGILGIFIEFQAPGLIFPGLFGLVCLAIVFGVQVLPINWFGAVLIFLALGFFVAEIFITSFGILMIAGLALLIVGSYLLFAVPGSSIFVEPFLIWLFSGLLALLMIIVGVLIVRAKRQGPTANVDALVGSTAEVSETIGKESLGRVLLNGSYWRARAHEPIPYGAKVRIIKVDNTIVWVEKIKEE